MDASFRESATVRREASFITQSLVNLLMTLRVAFILSLALIILIGSGCSTTPPKSENAAPAQPETVVQVAGLNLTDLNKRIDRSQIAEFVKVLKREQIDMLAVQGVARYPGVATRVDFVDELSSQGDLRSGFGEMLNNSGRQTGNAIFSTFPILSHFNQSFEQVKAVDFEAGIEATIDAGVRSLGIISARLPGKASTGDQAKCLSLLSSLSMPDKKQPVIIAGNLPDADTLRNFFGCVEIPRPSSVPRSAPRIWYSSSPPLKLLESHVIETSLGSMVVARFGVFRP